MIEDHAGDDRAIVTTETNEVKPDILSSTPDASGLRLRLSFHFPEIMLNIITRSTIIGCAAHRSRCSVSDSLAMCPEYKVVTCRIRKAKKAHLRKAGEVVAKA